MPVLKVVEFLPATRMSLVTVNLPPNSANVPLAPISNITYVSYIRVVVAPSDLLIKIGAYTEIAVPAAVGQERSNLACDSIFVVSAIGGLVTCEVHGR